jgi:hypothetical protein
MGDSGSISLPIFARIASIPLFRVSPPPPQENASGGGGGIYIVVFRSR